MPSADRPPLWGIPFAVKDNIDVEGFITTAACKAFAYMPKDSAPAVQALLNAGKTLAQDLQDVSGFALAVFGLDATSCVCLVQQGAHAPHHPACLIHYDACARPQRQLILDRHTMSPIL